MTDRGAFKRTQRSADGSPKRLIDRLPATPPRPRRRRHGADNMTIVERVTNQLRSIQQKFLEIKAVGPAWRTNALNSCIELTQLYQKDLDMALTLSNESEQKRVCCVISGMRKGVVDLGILTQKEHALLIGEIDRVSALALCIYQSN